MGSVSHLVTCPIQLCLLEHIQYCKQACRINLQSRINSQQYIFNDKKWITQEEKQGYYNSTMYSNISKYNVIDYHKIIMKLFKF